MITNINEFNKKIENGQLKIVEGIYIENFDEMSADETSFDDMDDMDDMGEESLTLPEDEEGTEEIVEETPLTLDMLKDALLNNFNTDEEGQETIMVSDEQLDIIYNTLIELGVVKQSENIETEEGDEGTEEFETEETEEGDESIEEIEEGLGKFLKKTVKEDDESIAARRAKLIQQVSKLEGKDVYAQVAKQPETLVSFLDNSVEDIVDKIGKKDTYNGTFLKAINVGGKTIFTYKPGASGFLAKAGAAASGLTTAK